MSKSTLKQNTELALKAPEGAPVPQAVWLPPSVRGNPPRVVQNIAINKDAPSVHDNIIRITENSDPIGMLMAIANGQPVATFSINEDGEVVAAYETLTLKERLGVIRFLADKVLPKMSMVITSPQKPGDKDAWAATVENAAGRE